MTIPAGWYRDGLILRYFGDLDADYGFTPDQVFLPVRADSTATCGMALYRDRQWTQQNRRAAHEAYQRGIYDTFTLAGEQAYQNRDASREIAA